jgi:hypothetical protein
VEVAQAVITSVVPRRIARAALIVIAAPPNDEFGITLASELGPDASVRHEVFYDTKSSTRCGERSRGAKDPMGF